LRGIKDLLWFNEAWFCEAVREAIVDDLFEELELPALFVCESLGEEDIFDIK